MLELNNSAPKITIVPPLTFVLSVKRHIDNELVKLGMYNAFYLLKTTLRFFVLLNSNDLDPMFQIIGEQRA